MKLSVVATLYQSAPHIAEFYARTSLSARQLAGDDYEILLVNDGSPDSSLEIALSIAESDPRVVVIDLSRNFGHHKAMMTGLLNSVGDLIFLIDSDLEEQPEYLIEFAEQLKTSRSDVVYGVQEKRKGGVFERISGRFFWWFFNCVTGLALHANTSTVRLMTRRYVDGLVQHREREIFMAGLWYITGFRQTSITIKKGSNSESTYNFSKKMALLVNSVTSFSNAPLVGIFYAGMLISFIAGLFTAYVLTRWAFFDRPLSGWTSVMASLWILGGMLISSIGIVGIYLSKIFSETKQRPYTIVRNIYRKSC